MKLIIWLLILLFIITGNLIADTGPEPPDYTPVFDDHSYSHKRCVCLGIVINEKLTEDYFDLDDGYGIIRRLSDDYELLFEDRKYSVSEAVGKIWIEAFETYSLLFLESDICIPGEMPGVEYYLFSGTIPENVSLEEYVSKKNIIDRVVLHIDENEQDCDKDEVSPCDNYNMIKWEEPDINNDAGKSSGHGITCGCDISGRDTSFPLALFMFFIGMAAWAITRRAHKK